MCTNTQNRRVNTAFLRVGRGNTPNVQIVAPGMDKLSNTAQAYEALEHATAALASAETHFLSPDVARIKLDTARCYLDLAIQFIQLARFYEENLNAK